MQAQLEACKRNQDVYDKSLLTFMVLILNLLNKCWDKIKKRVI